MIRVLVWTDICLLREGLAHVLDRQDELTVVGAVAERADGLACLTRSAPDIVLLDLGMPDGLALVSVVHQHAPGARVVALAVAEKEYAVLECIEAGAAGYVPRGASVDSLVSIVRSVARGETICSPRMTATLFRRVAELTIGSGAPTTSPALTVRELETMRLVDRGLSNKEIAQRLGIEVATVKNHVHNILEKLQVHRRGEAAARLRGTRRHITPVV
jgi:two-component system, NarL family, nitrate/nitrite response regulator NarL